MRYPTPPEHMTVPRTAAEPSFVAFRGTRRIASGELAALVRGIFREGGERSQGSFLAFNAVTSEPLELDLRGTEPEAIARVESASLPVSPAADKRGPGRPRLGVVPREITLLPRHWDWLNRQPGGASAAVRRLVDAARGTAGLAAGNERVTKRTAQEYAYRFLSAMLGDHAGFEDATRALFAGDAARFEEVSAGWPADLRDHARRLARATFNDHEVPIDRA